MCAGTRGIVSAQQPWHPVWEGRRPGQDPVLTPSDKSSPKHMLLGLSFPFCNGEAESQEPAVALLTGGSGRHARQKHDRSQSTGLFREVRQRAVRGQQVQAQGV